MVIKSDWHIVEVAFPLGNEIFNAETVKFKKILCCVYHGLPTKQNRGEIWDKIISGPRLKSRTRSIEKAFYRGKTNPPKPHECDLCCVISLRRTRAVQRDRTDGWNCQRPGHVWPPSSGKSPRVHLQGLFLPWTALMFMFWLMSQLESFTIALRIINHLVVIFSSRSQEARPYWTAAPGSCTPQEGHIPIFW